MKGTCENLVHRTPVGMIHLQYALIQLSTEFCVEFMDFIGKSSFVLISSN